MVVEVNRVGAQLLVSVRETPESSLMSWDVPPLVERRPAVVDSLVGSNSGCSVSLGAVIIRLNFKTTEAAEGKIALVCQTVKEQLS